MPYITIADVIADVNAKITANGTNDITGTELNTILLGIIQFIDPKLQAELIAKQGSGGYVGGTQDGETFAIGTSLENVIRDTLIRTIHPTYLAPTLAMSTNVATLTQEAGATISPQFSIVFTQNNGGSILTRTLKKNTITISSAFPYTDASASIGDGDTVYEGNVTYAIGPVLNNNLGAPDAVGQIAAGTAYAPTITYIGQRKIFGGTPAATPTTSAHVRALSVNTLNAQVGTELIIPIIIGATRVAFAYPATLPDVTLVEHLELGGLDVKSLFTQTLVNVEGANGYAAISYKVYTYVPIEPFAAAITYKVTI